MTTSVKDTDIKADRIGLETGTYALNCGCRIYVHFPGGHIHLSHGWSQCPELARLWATYMTAARTESWESLTLYIDCLRHVGAWQGRIDTIKRLRAHYPNPDESRDYPTTVTEEDNTYAAA